MRRLLARHPNLFMDVGKAGIPVEICQVALGQRGKNAITRLEPSLEPSKSGGQVNKV